MELLLPNIRAKRVQTCRAELNENLPAVLMDPDVLTQVFINLMHNGLRATPEGGELIVRTYETDGNLHIDFINPDTGAMLKKAELLFLPFDEGGEREHPSPMLPASKENGRSAFLLRGKTAR